MRKISKIEPRLPSIPKRKKVAAYARVSMECDRLMHSISAQISYYSSLIQSHAEWEYAGVYADYGISGTGTVKRTEFQRMLADCESGKINIILCKSISRFARNTVDLLETVRHLKAIGVEVRFEKENISSMSGDGELMLSILASFAQEESRSISENCKWAIRKGFQNGIARFSLLYGYRSVNGIFMIEDSEAEVVRWIFQQFLIGDSCYIIAVKLNEMGIKSYYGKEWSGSVIGGILRQEKYTGNSLLQKYFVEDCITHKEQKNKGELPMYYVENTHPAIISQDIFDKVQREFVVRYGVKIKNGTAEKAGFMYHNGEYEKPDFSFRKAQWSEEQRKRHSEIYQSRETMKFLHHDLSLFIKCEVCGRNLTGQYRTFADGSRELRWVCFNHNKELHQKKISLPRPPVMRDDALKSLIAEVMETEHFNTEIMCETLSKITAYGEMLTFHFHDGRKVQRKYIPPKRGYRRKEKI